MTAETSVAEGASAVLNVADALPPVALALTGISMMEIPTAGLCLTQMLEGCALPGGLGSAAVAWTQVGASVDEAKQKLKDVTDAIPSDAWTSEDREAFNKKIEELGTQLETLRIFTDVAALTLVGCGAAIAAFDTAAAVMGGVLFAQFVAIVIAESTGVGFLGPAEAIMGEAITMATEFAGNLKTGNGILKTVGKVAAGVFAGAELLHEIIQAAEGNNNVLGDTLKGAAIAAPEIALSALLGKGAEVGAGKLLGKFAGKDLAEAAKEAATESGRLKGAADEAEALSAKAAQAAEDAAKSGAKDVFPAIQNAADLTEAAGKAAHDSAAASAKATLAGIDGVAHGAIKTAAGKAGEYTGAQGGEYAGQKGKETTNSWIDSILNR
jgi:hypothetical protein